MNPHLALLLSAAYPRGLAPEHLADLRKSTITDETIRAQHIMSVPPAMFGRLLGFDVPDVRSMMLLPFLASGAGFIGHVRVKIFPELKGKDCHSTKYLQPRGSSPRLYFVTCCMDSVLRGDGPVWFVEGEKKALSVGQLGLSAVGFSGAEGWHRSGTRTLLEDFDAIQLWRREAELLPDGDVRSNVNVADAMRRFSAALRDRGARPRIRMLPERAA